MHTYINTVKTFSLIQFDIDSNNIGHPSLVYMRPQGLTADIHAALQTAASDTHRLTHKWPVGCRGIHYRPTRNLSATTINLVDGG